MATGNDNKKGNKKYGTEQPSEVQRLFEENPIMEVFDKPSNLRVVIVLIDAGGVGLTVSDITQKANIEPQTFYQNEEMLLEYGLIEKSDKIGNAQTYRVDLSNDIIQAVMNLYGAMSNAA